MRPFSPGFAAPSVVTPLRLEARRQLVRAWRFLAPAPKTVLVLVGVALLVGVYLRAVQGRLEAERTAAWACQEAVRAIVRASRVHDRAVLPEDPCRALRLLKGEDA